MRVQRGEVTVGGTRGWSGSARSCKLASGGEQTHDSSSAPRPSSACFRGLPVRFALAKSATPIVLRAFFTLEDCSRASSEGFAEKVSSRKRLVV